MKRVFKKKIPVCSVWKKGEKSEMKLPGLFILNVKVSEQRNNMNYIGSTDMKKFIK